MDRAKSTDAELVEASRRGERAAFGELVDRCARTVAAVSYAATRDRTLSEDITQETFVAAWCDLARLRDASAVRPWLCGIARNLAHKARRRRIHEVAVADPDTFTSGRTPFDVARDRQLEQVVAAALARVPDVYREALVLFYYEQRSARDVAAALGVTEDVVHKRLSRGRRYLAQGVEALVANELERRRGSRRDVAATVLAALPLAPSQVATATKGSSMLKLGALGIAAATVMAVVSTARARPHADASPPQPVVVPPVPTTKPLAARAAPPAIHAPVPPQLPVLPVPAAGQGRAAVSASSSGPLTCQRAAAHVIEISLAQVPDGAHGREKKIQLVTDHLAKTCLDEQWSQTDLECVMAAEDMPAVRDCTAEETPPPATLPTLAPAGTKLACAVIGKHVAKLMIASMSGLSQDNVAASILEDSEELMKEVQEQCSVDHWSDTQRRCYAGATRFQQIVLCNLQAR